jgi:ferredoxin
MPTIVFEPAPSAGAPDSARSLRRATDAPVALTVSAPEGGALADVCDDAGAPVPFSCRGANCGTCRIEVLEGASELTAPEAEEIRILELFAAAPSHRLACCVKMRPGLAVVRVRVVGDDE